ncbi:MAG TPA: Rieske 2Fe-2S domain-containing protein [Verrucomicrobiae bacterium]|nr:Rieske 2Fe-2S domain-containing protein [Verrucomicrobiae bacterium]
MKRAPSIDLFPTWPASWYLFGASGELANGPVSKTMLDQRLVAFRGKSGALAVMDARCSHLGADLGCGRVEGDAVICPYHSWRYTSDGICTHAAGMAQPPRFARQRTFPVVERHGYVFFFNGPTPLFPLPFFLGENADHYAAGRVFRYEADCSWFVNSAHAFDRQHFDAVHDRRLLAPPEIDCPAPFARRNRYRAEVLGRTPLDRLLRFGAGKVVEISLTVWGGTFVCITGNFRRARSRFLMVTRPLENGHTLCEGIVLTPRPANPLALWVRRLFTHGYLADEARQIRGTRYEASRFVEADEDMINYFHWLVTLPQTAVPTPQVEPALA